MTRAHSRNLIALASGVLFGAGLLLSGMTQPAKILGFLDVFGAFDPSLMFVMVGAIAVFATAYRWTQHRDAPLLDSSFHRPSPRPIDAQLLLGAAIFGAGWGLSGYCPGPSVVALPGAGLPVALFVTALIAGSVVTAKLESRLAERRARPDALRRDVEAGTG